MENLEEMAQKHGDSDGILLSSMAQYKIEESVLSVYNHSSINPFTPGDFAEKRVLKLVEWFSGHCRAIKS